MFSLKSNTLLLPRNGSGRELQVVLLVQLCPDVPIIIKRFFKILISQIFQNQRLDKVKPATKYFCHLEVTSDKVVASPFIIKSFSQNKC